MERTTPKYDRDHLVNLLAERVAFEHAAVELYDALLGAIGKADTPVVQQSRDALAQHREEEREHAEWLEGLLRKLGGTPSRDLPDAVNHEARAFEEVISEPEHDGARLLPMFYAMLGNELMDAEGWKLLLEVADELDDRAAVDQLRTRVEREDEHVALLRHILLTLAKDSVRYYEGAGREASRHDGRSSRGAAAPRGTQRGAQRGRQALDVAVSGPARATTDHDEIRRWAESRGGKPAHVKRKGRGDLGILRIDFPGWSGEKTLEAVDWDSWFRAFDDNDLALVYEEKTANGKPSRFNKLVARQTVLRRLGGEHDAAVHKGRRNGGGRRGNGGGARRTSGVGSRKQGARARHVARA